MRGGKWLKNETNTHEDEYSTPTKGEKTQNAYYIHYGIRICHTMHTRIHFNYLITPTQIKVGKSATVVAKLASEIGDDAYPSSSDQFVLKI